MASARYAFRDGWRLVVRHWGLSLLTIFTAMAVFYVIGASTLFVMNVRHIVSKLEDQLTIQAYVKPGVDLDALAKKISALEEVRDTKVITKELALERLRTRLGNQVEAVSLLGENPLPPSIEVRVDKASQVSNTALKIDVMDDVDDVVFAGPVAEKLSKVSNFAGQFSVVLLVVAFLASGVVLFNTIRISVYSREEEINVMVMVGATSTYVAMPFVIQGFLLGFAGALLAFLFVGGTYFSAIVKLKDMLPFLTFIESPQLLYKLGFMLVCCGATVSLIASLLAVEKFIKNAMEPL
ncbi:permease-like cell division protein FtsX [Synergistaceae bacterium OttesenSCG-928-D05]|nr:permease-like cell division protein FtsX [Synergistaceae bacterium OttesenSCG-928-D05]